MEERFERIEIGKISPSPHNRREQYTGQAFDELVASIAERGVLEPVLVRPLNGDGTFQLIAGERRWRAAYLAGLADIPAVIRPMDDVAAMECTIIENLQREDLSEIEEAKSFKDYLDTRGGHPEINGVVAIENLAKAIGKSTTYIRRRVRVLDLPPEVLKLWETGELIYSHLEQLIRLDNGKNALILAKKFLGATQYNKAGRTLPALIDMLNNDSPKISIALFGKELCAECPKNTDVQKRLWGMAEIDKDARCLDPGCFKHHQNDWLMAHWKQTKAAKQHGTNGFWFYDIHTSAHNRLHQIYGTAKEKCKECEDLVSLVTLGGNPVSWFNTGCAKAKADCYNSTYKTASPYQAPPENLGPVFRNRYYQEGLNKALAGATLDDDRVLRLILNDLTDEWSTREAFVEEALGGLTEAQKSAGAWEGKYLAISTLSGAALREAFGKAILIRMKTQQSWLSSVLPLVARDFGVDLKYWKISADYLNRKDPKQLVKLAKELLVFDDPVVEKYMKAKHQGKKPADLDKKQLAAVFMKSGLDLTGLVPKEILNED